MTVGFVTEAFTVKAGGCLVVEAKWQSTGGPSLNYVHLLSTTTGSSLPSLLPHSIKICLYFKLRQDVLSLCFVLQISIKYFM